MKRAAIFLLSIWLYEYLIHKRVHNVLYAQKSDISIETIKCRIFLLIFFLCVFTTLWKEEQNVFPQINSKTHNLRIIFLIFIWSDSFFLINHRGIKASSKYHIQIFISLHKLRNQCLRKNWKYWFFINFRNIFE